MMKIIFIMLSLNFMLFILKNYLMNKLIIQNIMLLTLFILFFNNFFNYYWIMYYKFGMDHLSWNLLILNFWIISLSMLSKKKILKNNKFIQIFILLMMLISLTFLSTNLMIFYIFFEMSLIPITLIIMGWGLQIDRIQASMYMLFYTLFGSLPLLIMIIYIFYNKFSLSIMILKMNYLNLNNLFYFLMINLAFFIKMPMYLTHLWLPKAHVEAPIMGSMILAGTMLKLGSYGLYRLMNIIPYIYINFSKYMILINLLGSLICSLICMNQSDMKIIIAYSSIVHMSIMLAGMMSMSNSSFKGSILMMISHGLCSSCMFFSINLIYERLNSRNMFINKNLINILPSLTLWMFLIFSSNFPAPPSLNLFSEILIFISLIQWNKFLILLISFISFFNTCYSIFIYAYSQYGKMNYSQMNFVNINCKEYLNLMLHWMPLNLIFLKLNMFIF
uniref:NADH dehydrogenase subunit 4 n=1 Tax=Euurobracon yokahamae TaxID=2911681 RepID=UPI00207A0676|nr:NADH dehydrogenase subunit 4 [Euurobracon yokahamae]UJJ81891.1 NADH dehydrogenase subunit 4 [Euurobracon yokahamae]